MLRASGELEGRTCTTRKTSRTIDSEIDYGLSRLANGKLRQGKAQSGNKQKSIPHNRSTNPKAMQYLAPHPKPIQSLKISYSSCASYTSCWPKAKREAPNPPPCIPSQKYTLSLLQHLFDQSFSEVCGKRCVHPGSSQNRRIFPSSSLNALAPSS